MPKMLPPLWCISVAPWRKSRSVFAVKGPTCVSRHREQKNVSSFTTKCHNRCATKPEMSEGINLALLINAGTCERGFSQAVSVNTDRFAIK